MRKLILLLNFFVVWIIIWIYIWFHAIKSDIYRCTTSVEYNQLEELILPKNATRRA